MVQYKHMIVLANSIKKSARCIAGKEVTLKSNYYEIGPWVRPITNHDEGAVWLSECTLNTGGVPKVMQFVKVPFTRYAEDATQPENWMIATGVQWESVDALYAKPDMSHFVELPRDLWLQKEKASDRITVQAMARRAGIPSIHVIRVEQLIISFGWQHYDPRKKRRRAEFVHNGVEYDFSLTDPVIEEKYGHLYPQQGATAFRFSANNAKPCHISVSLAPPFCGDHYKVVATVFEEQ